MTTFLIAAISFIAVIGGATAVLLYKRLPEDFVQFADTPTKDAKKPRNNTSVKAEVRAPESYEHEVVGTEVFFAPGKKWTHVTVPAKAASYEFALRTSDLRAVTEQKENGIRSVQAQGAKSADPNFSLTKLGDEIVMTFPRTNSNPILEVTMTQDTMKTIMTMKG